MPYFSKVVHFNLKSNQLIVIALTSKTIFSLKVVSYNRINFIIFVLSNFKG